MPLESAAGPEGPAPGSLRRDCLSFMEVVAQSVANIAPSATPALIIPAVFASSGNGLWIAYAFATIALLFVTYHINQFARRSASPGALYTFVAQGMGSSWGVISGWSLVIAYLITGGATLCGAANYVGVLLSAIGGVNATLVLSIFVVVAVAVGAWYLAYRDIELSTKFMLSLEGVSVGIVMLLAIAFYVKTGHVVDARQFSTAGLTPTGLTQGLVLAFFSFVGFESATALGHEAKDPLRSIPRSVLVTVVAVGAFFTFMSYTLVNAFAASSVSLGQSNKPMTELAIVAGLPVLGTVFAAGATVGFFACALACINAGARVIYMMSKHGLVHDAAAGTHDVHATPHVAVTLAALVVLLAPLGLLLGKTALLDAFGYLGFVATFGFLFAYILVSIAAPLYLRRRGELRPASVVMSVLSVAMLAVATVGSIVLSPTTPYNFLPYVFLALLAAGVGRFIYLRVAKPGVIAAIDRDLLGEAMP
ncbi:MAG TPA: APC family permease [Candidatus Eremiobacteraceae bacterium]|nr:APC family permease [Candidatus Eremiobacteraceae bacterium]